MSNKNERQIKVFVPNGQIDAASPDMQTVKCSDCGKEITVPKPYPHWICLQCAKEKFPPKELDI